MMATQEDFDQDVDKDVNQNVDHFEKAKKVYDRLNKCSEAIDDWIGVKVAQKIR